MDASGTVDSSRAPQLVVADVGIISPPPANNPRRGQSRTVTAQALAHLCPVLRYGFDEKVAAVKFAEAVEIDREDRADAHGETTVDG